MIDLRIKSINN